ncbi:MAG: hypothetical protein AB7K24_22785, partial [Gemmataceae bacterium]
MQRWSALCWGLLGLLAAAIWLIRLDGMLRLGGMHSTTGFEDISIFNISLMQHGAPAYSDCFEYPYRLSLFNWFFYACYAQVAAIVDPSEERLPAVLRLITVAWSCIGFATMVRLFLGSAPLLSRLQIFASIGLALAVWYGPFLGWWSMTVRPDVPAVVCEFLGLFIVLRRGEKLSWPWAVAAALCFFLGWSFKQNAVMILAGCLLALALRRQWTSALRIAAVFAFLAGLVLLLAPPAYFTNTLAPRVTPFQGSQYQAILFWWAISWGPLLLLGPLLLWLGFAGRRRERLGQWSLFLPGVVFLVVLPANLLAMGRVGSSCNYLFESWLVGMTLVGLLTLQAGTTDNPPGPDWQRSLFLALGGLLVSGAVLSVVPLFHPFQKEEGWPLEVMLRLPREPYAESLLSKVRACRGPLLADDSYLIRQAMGAEAVKVPVVDLTIYPDARAAGLIRDGGIEQRIRDRKFSDLWLEGRESYWADAARNAGYVV